MKRISFKYLFVTLLLLAILFSGYLPNQVLSTNSNSTKNNSASLVSETISSTTYTNHGPVVIKANNEFTSNGFTGGGTKAKPYVFQNYNVIPNASYGGFDIENTTAYFIIRNCNISINVTNSMSGIYLTAVSNAVILNNIIIGYSVGISTSSTNNLTVMNNYAQSTISTADAFDIETTNNSIVSNNLANNSIYDGIYTYQDINGTFSNNTVLNPKNIGIYAETDTNISFVNNNVSNSQNYVIDVEGTNNALVFTNNSIQFNKIGIITGSNNLGSNAILKDNLVANSSQEGFLITGFTNVTLTGNMVTGSGYAGVFLNGQDVNINISNNFINQNGIINGNSGLAVDAGTVNITISNNVITQNGNAGIHLNSYFNLFTTGHTYAIITNNTISQNLWYGIALQYSDNNTVIYNMISSQQNDEGVGLLSSNYNKIFLNTFLNNYASPSQIFEATGLTNYFDNGHFGNYYSNYNGTDANHDGIGDTNYTIDQTNHNDTMPLMNPSYLTITSPANVIIDEGTTGQQLTWQLNTYDSIKYSVLMNQSGPFTALVANSIWSKPIQQSLDGLPAGTYVFTVTITDLNTSLIFQTSGLATIKDVTAPVLTVSTPSITYVAGTTGHTINVNASDLHPASYVVYENNTQVAKGSWSNSVDIQVSVDGLSAGYYIFKVVVFDTSNNSANVTVDITVTPAPSTTPTTSPTSSSSASTQTTTSSSKSGSTPSFEAVSTLIGLVALLGYEVRRRRK